MVWPVTRLPPVISCTPNAAGRSAWRTTRPDSADAPGVFGVVDAGGFVGFGLAGVCGVAGDAVFEELLSSLVRAPRPYPTAPTSTMATVAISHRGRVRPLRVGSDGAGGSVGGAGGGAGGPRVVPSSVGGLASMMGSTHFPVSPDERVIVTAAS